MFKTFVVLGVIVLGMIGYMFWPQKAGANCLAFRARVEAHCQKNLDKDYEKACISARAPYDDSIRERVNDEGQCKKLNKIFSDVDAYKKEMEQIDRDHQKKLEDISKTFR